MMAIAARIPMMATTTRSSMRVNPRRPSRPIDSLHLLERESHDSTRMIVGAVRDFLAACGAQPYRIVAAVSGGADSTALLVALAELRAEGFEIAAAHVNHHLRGTESDDDEAFVRELCDRFSIELDVADGTLDPAAVKRAGIEAAARET